MRNYERRLEREQERKRVGDVAWARYQKELKRREAIVKQFPIFKTEAEAIKNAVKAMAKEMKEGIKDNYSGEIIKGVAETTIYEVPKELGGGFLVAPYAIAMEAIEWLGMDYYDDKKMRDVEMQAKKQAGHVDEIDEL